MKEPLTVISSEEYEELQHFKSIAQNEDMMVYIKHERYELGYGSHVWFIYTKDEAVRKITDELNEATKELEKSREQCKQLEEENEKKSPSTCDLVINVLLFCIAVALWCVLLNS